MVIKRMISAVTVVAIFATVAFLVALWLTHRCRPAAPILVAQKEFQVPEEVYRPPIVRLPRPFKQAEQPVKSEQLPIPRRQVAKTIEVQLPEAGRSLQLVVSKTGKIYTTKDTPPEWKISAKDWQPPLFNFEPRLGFSVVHDARSFFFCLSYDPIQVGRVSVGIDVGINPQEKRWLAGTSLKYQLASLSRFHDGALLKAVGGWDWLNKRIYLGGAIQW